MSDRLRIVFNKANMPRLDGTTGDALKTRPMLAAVLPRDLTIPAPWGGELSGLAGVHGYMIQAMDNGKGSVDGYFNLIPQMFHDYHVVGDRLANHMTDAELAAICEDLPARLAHVRSLLGPDVSVWILERTRANQKVLGRARESGAFETAEGTVQFDEGAYFNEDSKGRVWPIDACTFERDYRLLK